MFQAGRTPLHCAVEGDLPKCLDVLIKLAKQLPQYNPHGSWSRKSPDKYELISFSIRL